MDLSLQIEKSEYLQPLFQQIKIHPQSMYNDGFSLHSKESEDRTQEISKVDILLSKLQENNSVIRINPIPRSLAFEASSNFIPHLLDIKSLKFITIPDRLHAFHIECCTNTIMYYTRERLIHLKDKNIFADTLVDLDAFPLSRLDQVYFVFEYTCPRDTLVDIPEMKIIYKEKQDLRVWSYSSFEIEDDWHLDMFRRVIKENICLDNHNNPISVPDGFRGLIKFKIIKTIHMQSNKSNAFDGHIRGTIGDAAINYISN
jgi:hypothetical protein